MMPLGLVTVAIICSRDRRISTKGGYEQDRSQQLVRRFGFCFASLLYPSVHFLPETDDARNLNPCLCARLVPGPAHPEEHVVDGAFERALDFLPGWFRGLCEQRKPITLPVLRLISKLRALLPFFLAVFSITRIPTASALENGDDFSNNLFTDLAPILSLFGEQVAKQFMAGSLGWSDNILFAMVPLGIITAIIGAIRIGGTGWLKAIVGRARENRTSAEVELTTSTSDEVCELYNGQAVVRMIGAPKILELLCFSTETNQHNHGLFTVGTAVRDRRMKAAPVPWHHWATSFIQLRYEEKSEESPSTMIRTTDEESPPPSSNLSSDDVQLSLKEKSAPNISLNLAPRNTMELRYFAIFGVMLQGGLLIFFGFSTYNDQLKQRIGGETSPRHGYPLAAIGTFILVVGMLICSFAVEASTTETSWNTSDSAPNKKFRILWLQRGETVNDQVFDSYAIFRKGESSSVLSSVLSTKMHAAAKARIKESDTSSNSTIKGSHHTRIEIPTEALVVFGALASISGFVVQFTGLRSMHWSASVAQLTITLIMVIVRAYVRREMGDPPYAQKIPRDHELDWLATRMATEEDRRILFEGSRNTSAADSDRFWSEDCWKWDIRPASDTTNFRFYQSSDLQDPELPFKDETRLNDVVRIREQLGLLSKWRSGISDTAVGLKVVIEDVMNVLFPKKGERLKWWWPLRCTSKGSIFLSVTYINGRWTASAAQIEAVLSLWIYSAQTRQTSKTEGGDDSSATGNPHSQPEAGKEACWFSAVDRGDWLGSGYEALRPTNLRLLGPVNDNCLRDLSWYFDKGLTQLMEAEVVCSSGVLGGGGLAIAPSSKEHASATNETTGSEFNVDLNRVIGLLPMSEEKDRPPDLTLRVRLYDLDWSKENVTRKQDCSGTEGKRFIVTTSNVPLNILYAQEMFSVFMWAVAEKMEPLGGDTTLDPGDSDWRSFKLENTVLTKILNSVERVTSECLGSIDDVYFSILPALSIRGKLPTPSRVFEHASTVARSAEAAGRWDEAKDAFVWLFRVCKNLPQELRVRGTAILVEFTEAAEEAEKVSNYQQRGYDELGTIRGVVSSVQKEKATAEPAILKAVGELVNLMSNPLGDGWSAKATSMLAGLPVASQLHREVVTEFDSPWRFYAEDKVNGDTRAKDIIGLTPIHYAAILGKSEAANYLLRIGTKSHKSNWPPSHDIDSFDRTALHYAVAFGHEGVVKRLCAERTRHSAASLPDISGRTPLHYVGEEPIAWELLQLGAPFEVQDRNGASALHSAVDRGVLKVVKLFVQAGATIESLDNSRRTPLHWAAYRRHEKVIEFLVDEGAKSTARDDNGRIPLHLAAAAGATTEVLSKLIKSEQDIHISDRKGIAALHLAAGGGHEATVRALVDLHAEVDAQDYQGRTPLHWATEAGRKVTASVLLVNLKADVEAKDRNGQTPLHLAAQEGHQETVQTLVDLDAEVNAKDADEQTPLHLAARGGHEKIVQALVALGANVNAKDRLKLTPQHLAAREGHEMTVRELANLLAKVDAQDGQGRTPLHLAAGRGYIPTVHALIVDLKANVEAEDDLERTPLHRAAGRGHDATVRVLVDLDAKVDAQDVNEQTPLHRAAQEGHDSTVRTLVVDFKADVEAKDHQERTPLHLAAREGHDSTVRALVVDLKADIEAKDHLELTPLHLAAGGGHDSTVRALVDLRAEVNAEDGDGETPLHRAAHEGHDSTVHTLVVDLKADIEAKDHLELTPLHRAAQKGHEATVRALVVDLKADVEAKDRNGRTPLHWAVVGGHEATIRALVADLRADVEAKDCNGRTPLHWAAVGCRDTIVHALVADFKADFEAKDDKGQTPLNLAVRKNHEKTMNVLVELGAAPVADTR